MKCKQIFLNTHTSTHTSTYAYTHTHTHTHTHTNSHSCQVRIFDWANRREIETGRGAMGDPPQVGRFSCVVMLHVCTYTFARMHICGGARVACVYVSGDPPQVGRFSCVVMLHVYAYTFARMHICGGAREACQSAFMSIL